MLRKRFAHMLQIVGMLSDVCVFVSGSSWACFQVCLSGSSCQWEFVSVLTSRNLSVCLQGCVCPYVCRSVFVHVFPYVCQSVFVHVSASVCFSMSASLCLYMCLPVCICPCVCLYLDEYKVRDGSCVSARASDVCCVCAGFAITQSTPLLSNS